MSDSTLSSTLKPKRQRRILRGIGLSLCWLALFCLLTTLAQAAAPQDKPTPIPIIQSWRGDYPAAELKRLPDNQRQSRVGYLGDDQAFAAVWQAFKPGEAVPKVDFEKHIVVFSHNTQFYNRTSIAAVTMREGVLDLLSMETRSSLPIEDKVAMGMAVISRADVKSINAGDQQIVVTPPAPKKKNP